jgi:hypothetical protein
MEVSIMAVEICNKQAGGWRKKHVKVNMGIFASFRCKRAKENKYCGACIVVQRNISGDVQQDATIQYYFKQ